MGLGLFFIRLASLISLNFLILPPLRVKLLLVLKVFLQLQRMSQSLGSVILVLVLLVSLPLPNQ